MRSLLSCLILLWTFASSVHAVTYYVGPGGNNANSCATAQTSGTPKLTINGATGGVSCLSGGDTLRLLAGTYAEAIGSGAGRDIPAGTSGQHTIIEANPGAIVRIVPTGVSNPGGAALLEDTSSYITYRNLILDALYATNFPTAIGLYASNQIFDGIEVTRTLGQGMQGEGFNLIIRNCHIHHVGEYTYGTYYPYRGYHHAIYLFGAGNIIENNYIHDVLDGYAIQLYANTSIVRRNRIDNVYSRGVYALSGTATIYSNIFTRTNIAIQASHSGNLIYNNTIDQYTIDTTTPYEYNGARDSYGIIVNAGSGTRIKNNIITRQWSTGNTIFVDENGDGNDDGPDTTVRDDNVCTVAAIGCSVVQANMANIVVDADARNYHLTASSVARGIGNGHTGITPDFDGVAMATTGTNVIDAGALQYGTSTTAVALRFVQQPTDEATATSISPAITVEVIDGAGSRVTGSTAAITLTIGANPGGSMLSGTLTQNAVSGLATFANISLDVAGVGYTLVATSSGLTPVTSSTFTIGACTPGVGTHLAVIRQPVTVAVATAMLPGPIIAVRDNCNATVTTATDAITLSLATGTGTLSGNALAAVSGEAVFTALTVSATGTKSLQATATGLTPVTTNTFTVVEQSQPGGLIRHWRLDEGMGTSTADATGNGPAGTLVNGASWVAGLAGGSAVQFDATLSQEILVGTVAGLSNATAFSVSAVMKRASFSDRVLLGVWQALDAVVAVELWSNGLTYCIVANGTEGTYAEVAGLEGTITQLVTLAYNGNGANNAEKLKCYVNGQEGFHSYSGTIPSTSATFTQQMRLGSESNGTVGEFSTGTLDEVRIHDVTLSLIDHQALYQDLFFTGRMAAPSWMQGHFLPGGR